jgi:hypothetical protein
MTPRFLARNLSTYLLFSLILSIVALAKDNPTYTQIGHNISVGPNEQVSDVICIACSIHVRGRVEGDVTTVGGSIVIEEGAQVAGDVTTVAGDLRLDKGAKVSGDVTAVGGQVRRDPEAVVSGDVTSMGGRGWVVPILLTPFVILGLLIALVIWLVQRSRRPSVPVAVAR